jgi:hypothetical protein
MFSLGCSLLWFPQFSQENYGKGTQHMLQWFFWHPSNSNLTLCSCNPHTWEGVSLRKRDTSALRQLTFFSNECTYVVTVSISTIIIQMLYETLPLHTKHFVWQITGNQWWVHISDHVISCQIKQFTQQKQSVLTGICHGSHRSILTHVCVTTASMKNV